MPEGLTNAPFPLSKIYECHLMDMIDIIVIIYLDDILIYSTAFPSTNPMFRKYSTDFCTNGLLAHAENASSTSLLQIRLDICVSEGITMVSRRVFRSN